MKKLGSHLAASKGFTTIELLVTITILSILMAIADLSYDTVKAKIRYAQVKADFDAMTQAAYNDFTTSRDNLWALNVALGTPPSFTVAELKKWPAPPCPGWFYNWENYSAVPAVSAVRLTLHRADASALWSYCLENYGGNCMGNDGSGVPLEVTALPTTYKYIYCNE
jgi:prepilin-type N-terminal cleavage/methylation domain-containing protein